MGLRELVCASAGLGSRHTQLKMTQQVLYVCMWHTPSCISAPIIWVLTGQRTDSFNYLRTDQNIHGGGVFLPENQESLACVAPGQCLRCEGARAILTSHAGRHWNDTPSTLKSSSFCKPRSPGTTEPMRDLTPAGSPGEPAFYSTRTASPGG